MEIYIDLGKGRDIPEDVMHGSSVYYIEELDQILMTDGENSMVVKRLRDLAVMVRDHVR